MPRRFRTRIAWSPAPGSSDASAATSERDSSPRWPAASSSRRSTTSTDGACPTGRTSSAIRSNSPAAARPTLSTAGVAEPSTTAAPARPPRRIAQSRAWRRGVRSLLYAASCSSSTMTRPTSASGARTASRVPTTMSTSPDRTLRHSSARSPSPRPEWRSAIRASRSARSRSTSGSASAISGTRTSAGRPDFQDGGDRLDVDGGLARAGHPVEQERPRVAGRDRGADPGHGLRLRREELARRWPAPSTPDRAGGERSAGAFAHLRVHELPANQPGHGCPSVAAGQLRRGRLAARAIPPARPGRPPGEAPGGAPRPSVAGAGLDRRPALRAETDPALVAWPGARTDERPLEREDAGVGELSEATEQAGAPVRAGQLPDGSRATLELGEQVELRAAVRRAARGAAFREGLAGASSAISSSRSRRPGGSIARSARAGGAR